MRSVVALQCDVCNRSYRTTIDTQGLSILPRCTLTQNCAGNMHQLVSATSIAHTPEMAPEVAGLADWSQRNILYTHAQDVVSTSWTIKHGLSGDPQILCYGIRETDTYQYYVQILPVAVVHDYVTKQSIVTFSSAEYGTAQCITNTSSHTDTYSQSASIVQLGNDNGYITIGTLNTSDYVSATLQCLTTTNSYIEIVCASIGTHPDASSAWSDCSFVQANGKRYAVRTFNLNDAIAQQVKDGIVVDGSAIYISHLNNVAITNGEVIYLMSKSPHAITDKLKRTFVDASSINQSIPETFFNSSTLYAKESVVKNTYPPIIKTT